MHLNMYFNIVYIMNLPLWSITLSQINPEIDPHFGPPECTTPLSEEYDIIPLVTSRDQESLNYI